MRSDLTQAALVGTSTAGAPTLTDDPADALVRRLGGDVPAERRLVLAAGAAAFRARAGFVPPEAPAIPEPCPADTLPECPRRGAEVLREVLAENDVDLLIEAACRLVEVGLRVPSLLVPDFLGAPSRIQGRRDAVVAALRPVLGERGRWIARLAGKQWAWGTQSDDAGPSPDDEKVWKEGTPAQRLAVLARRRSSTPDVAREWLVAVWKTERAEARAEFLATFAAGLSLADEAFLESALDDRASSVRAVAAGLLAKLPGSAFARRAEERAAAMLGWTAPVPPMLWQKLRGGAGTPASLDAIPPAEIPKEWERDGIDGKPPEGIGERAFRLSQAIALVPPSRWSARFASSPAELVAAVAASEWRVGLLLGWSRAAIAFGDAGWALALWDSWPVHDAIREGILRAMARDAAERALASLFRTEPTSGFAMSFAARVLPRPWGEPLAAAVRDAVRSGHMSRASPPESIAHNADALAELAPAFPLEAIEETVALALSLELEGAAARRRDALVASLRLRQRIHQEIVP